MYLQHFSVVLIWIKKSLVLLRSCLNDFDLPLSNRSPSLKMLMCNLKSQRKLNKSSTRNRNTRTNLIVYILTRFSMLCIYVCPVGLLGIRYVLQDWLSWSENYWTALRILLSLLRCEWTNETSRKWLTVVIWLSWTVMDDFHGWLY